MKTNLEWLSEMEEPERSQAIENCKNSIPYRGEYKNTCLVESIYQSFDWSGTAEGFIYWITIKNKYADGKH